MAIVAASALLLSCSADTSSEETADRIFSVATYNVDGLPVCIPLEEGFMSQFLKNQDIDGVEVDDDNNMYFNTDGPGEDGSKSIGSYISGKEWDIFGLNEDFNYHTQIWSELAGYSQGTYQGGFFVNKEMYASLLARFMAKKPLFDIDGLEIGVKSDCCTIIGEQMIPWNSDAVYGYTSNGSDELTRKGFRYYQVLVTKGSLTIPVDFIILHTDAGSAAEDISAREKSFSQLLDYIKGMNSVNPLIIMGDWNSYYHRDNLRELFIDRLNAESGISVRDAWVESCNRGEYPQYGGAKGNDRLDKILFLNREDSSIRLELVSAGNVEGFIDADGTQLSDHLPVEASFRIVVE